MPLALQRDGAARGAIIGVAVATGVWLVVGAAIVLSGAASRVAAIAAETWTVDELRRLRRRGWRLVNGLKLRERADIDHVAVGPAGVLVVETKWAADAWPVGASGSIWMVDQLERAVRQIAQNRSDVARHFGRVLQDAPVHGVVVLWSPSGGQPPEARVESTGVTALQGRALRGWLKTLDAQELDPEGIRRVWTALEEQARIRDERDGPARPTLAEAFSRWFVQPFAGFMTAGYGLLSVGSFTGDWRVFSLASLAGTVVGLAAWRRPVLRPGAIGWMAGLALVATVVPLAVAISTALA